MLSSLDISRRNLALRGKEAFGKVVALADYAREEINKIGGYYAFSKELVNGSSILILIRQSSRFIRWNWDLPESKYMTF